MKSGVFLTGLAGASAVLLFAAGCSRDGATEEPKTPSESEAVPAEVAIDDSILYDLFGEVDGLLMAGQTNQANARFTAALSDAAFKDLREPLFSSMIRYFLFTGQFDEAKTQYLNALRTDPEIARPGFDAIYGAYLEKGDAAGALEWARLLATQDIGDDLRMTATDWLLSSLARDGQIDEMAAAAATALEAFAPAAFAPVLVRIAHEGISGDKTEVAARLLDAIQASSKKDAPEMVVAVKTVEVRIDAARKEWKKIADRIPELVAEVPDAQLHSALQFAFQTARAAKRYDMVDAMSSPVVMDERAAKLERTFGLCANEWIGVLFEGDPRDTASFPGRLAKLLQVKLDPRRAYSIYSRRFYEILDDKALIRECMPLVDSLIPLLPDEASQNGLRALQLDAAFLVDDYAAALAILEKGLPERDEAWHKMAIAKVKAHLALQNKQYDVAVKQFREFMDILPDEDQPDPASDVMYGKLTLLGNNEKRIGDIYVEAGNPDEAAKSYATAREWYEKALAANKAGQTTEDYIKAQIAALPGAAAKPVEAAPAVQPAEAPAAKPVEAAPAEAASAVAAPAEAPAESEPAEEE